MSHKIRKIVWSTRQSLKTVISMHVQKDSYALKFLMKLNVFNHSFMKKKSRFRKENETTHDNVTNLDIAARNQKIHHESLHHENLLKMQPLYSKRNV